MTAEDPELPLANLPRLEPGWVWLAGAGPGDPGLLTLHTLNGLRQADVVVYDALVGPEILTLARPQAQLQFAGKRGGKPSPTQRDISTALVEHARAGRRVLRLKGGDPLVFGRGGEEARALVAAGVPFRILPGISAGVGGLAYAGIPATDRQTNSAVTFLSGYGAGGGLPADIDLVALAQSGTTLVVFMALSHIAELVERLLAGGRSAAEPVALISNATLPTQRVVESTLGAVVGLAAEAGIATPAMMVVGEVVRLRAALDWYGALHEGRTLVADPLGMQARKDAI
ncbi:uroporphyrinogen-III C-methyltransferase [Govanella unica]|uniref:uroporphyrinogen-III C-methyltransferase n=1 Tax=Govanella unica TaxID=2975056 RepID=A0A9X3TXT7_9PROT|nr:uroporphyrinogen-III C-methyltransferase [Govania unica]MDA5193569.1 uroporphyrinogen-III C-methyltransferase [Govania unica]